VLEALVGADYDLRGEAMMGRIDRGADYSRELGIDEQLATDDDKNA
jgi:hypothetical protein